MTSTSRRRAAALSGLRDIAPILLGVAPFALIVGVTGVGVGLSALETQGLSLIVYAGASQLAAIELLSQDAVGAVVVFTVLVVNLRFVMYSASLTPHLREVPFRARLPLSYWLTDQGYAVCIVRFQQDETVSRGWYYTGTALGMWVTWQLGTAVGALVGATIPESWGFEFMIPLMFLALLVPQIRDRPGLVAAVIGGGVAVAAAPLPNNLGLITGALSGIVAGVATEARTGRGGS